MLSWKTTQVAPGSTLLNACMVYICKCVSVCIGAAAVAFAIANKMMYCVRRKILKCTFMKNLHLYLCTPTCTRIEVKALYNSRLVWLAQFKSMSMEYGFFVGIGVEVPVAKQASSRDIQGNRFAVTHIGFVVVVRCTLLVLSCSIARSQMFVYEDVAVAWVSYLSSRE